jgi:CheY-like chemotaxis protein
MALKDSLELVMVVDDDATDNFIAKRIIEITGFARNAIVTSSATEALGYLTAHQEYPEKLPAIIFLDINMPLHDGFDFLEKFGALSDEITTRCKVIILSSSANKKDIERILRNDHVIKFMTKPISEDALEEIRFIKPLRS